jgi:hypothetical protein
MKAGGKHLTFNGLYGVLSQKLELFDENQSQYPEIFNKIFNTKIPESVSVIYTFYFVGKARKKEITKKTQTYVGR